MIRPRMSDTSPDDELTKLQQRMAELKRETQRIDIELQALQAEGEARMAEHEGAGPKSGQLFNSQEPPAVEAE